MGLGRKEREEDLEDQHRQYIEGKENSEIPDHIQRMYEEEFGEFISAKRRRKTASNHLRTVRRISRVLMVVVIAICIASFIFMLKSC